MKLDLGEAFLCIRRGHGGLAFYDKETFNFYSCCLHRMSSRSQYNTTSQFVELMSLNIALEPVNALPNSTLWDSQIRPERKFL